MKHGTRSCYVKGCRRPECVAANRDYQRGYMRGRRPTVGGVRVFMARGGERLRQRNHPPVWKDRAAEQRKSWRTA